MNCACDLDNDKMCMLHKDIDAETLREILFMMPEGFCFSVNYTKDDGPEETMNFTSKTASKAFVNACDRSTRYKVIEYQGFEMPEGYGNGQTVD